MNMVIKMTNKVLVKVIFPELNISYDVYIPVNELIWKVKRMILKLISDLEKIDVQQRLECIMFNKNTCRFYNNNEIIFDTDIRNGTELILITSVE